MIKVVFLNLLFLSSLLSSMIDINDFLKKNHDVVLLIDPVNGAIIKANKSASDFYGYSINKLESMNIKDINTFTKEQIRLEMRRAKDEKRNHFIFKHKLSNGSTKKVEVHSYPITYEGKQVLFSIIHDFNVETVIEQFNERLNQQVDIQTNALKKSERTLILILTVSSLIFITGIAFLIYLLTQKKRLTEDLILTNKQINGLKERLELAVDGSNDGIWDWDMIKDHVYFSPRWKSMIGYNEDEIKNNYTQWESRVHPDDLKGALGAIEDHLSKKTKFYQATFRMKHKKGSWVWITARGKAHFEKDGTPTRMIGFHTDVTNLLNLQFDYKNLFNAVKEGIAVYSVEGEGERFIFKDINPAVEQIENLKREDIIGKDLLEIFPGAYDMGFVDILRSVYKSGKPTILPAAKYEDVRIEGYRRNHIYKLPNGDIVAIYEDLTEEYNRIDMLNNALDEKEYQNKYLTTLFDIQPNIVITKYKGVLEKVNRAFLDFFDCINMGEFKKDYECICDTFMDKEGYLLPRINGIYWVDHILNDPNTIHKALILKDNKEHEFIVNAKKLDFNEEDRAIVVFIDITRIKEQEELLIKQEKRAVMGDMLENIAHQWRQPLSIITTTASGIQIENQEGILDGEKLENDCENIIDQANHLSLTVDDFRDFYKNKKSKEEFFFSKSIDRTLKLISSKLKNRDIMIIQDIEDIKLLGVQNELIQVIMNIISNAVDELENKDQKRVIEISSNLKDGDFIIRIKNNGGNISEDIIHYVFNEHFTTKDASDGTGIGLHMSRVIIENSFNGKIEAQNIKMRSEDEVFNGVEFIITLPLI